jgi:predicted MFS family arabinose efflux permease
MTDPAIARRHLRLLIALVSLSSIGSSTARFAVYLAAAQSGASPATVGIIASVFAGVGTLVAVPVGHALDRFGVRAPMFWAAVLLCSSVLLGAFSRELPVLVAIVALGGVAFNTMVISFARLAGDLAPPDRRAEAFGMLGFGYSVSLLASPLIGGFAIDGVGFTWAFVLFALIPLGALAMVWTDALPWSPPVKAAAGKDGEAGAERRGTLALLATPELRGLWVCCIAFEAGWMCFTFMLPVVGTQLEFSASKIGLIAGTGGFTLFLTRGLLTKLLQWFSPWQVLITGLALGAIGFTGMAFASEFLWICACAAFIGFGQGACSPMLTALVYEQSAAHEKGAALALRTLTSNFSQFATPLAAGAVSTMLGATAVFAALAAFMGGVSWFSRGNWKRRLRRADDAPVRLP